MLTWAKVNKNNEVEEVILIDNSMPNSGADWIKENLEGNWIQTYRQEDVDNGSDSIRRKNPASPTMLYSAEKDVFYFPQPYPSWTLNNETLDWEAPSSKPEGAWIWNEETLAWVKP